MLVDTIQLGEHNGIDIVEQDAPSLLLRLIQRTGGCQHLQNDILELLERLLGDLVTGVGDRHFRPHLIQMTFRIGGSEGVHGGLEHFHNPSGMSSNTGISLKKMKQMKTDLIKLEIQIANPFSL